MGIRGLVTFCKNSVCYEKYDLVSLARNNKNLEILVDFYGFEHYILEFTLKNLVNKYNNKYLIIPGAEYDELINSFRHFHNFMTNIGIKLVYIVNGLKGFDKLNQNQEDYRIQRFLNDIKVHENYLTYCKKPINPCCKIREKIVSHYLMSDLFKNIVKDEGGEIINLVFGDGVGQIAKMRKERDSWAVLTNDSDFFVFHDCPTIQLEFFDMDKNLNLTRNYKEANEIHDNGGIVKLIVGVVSDDMIMKKLKFSTHDKLIDYAVLMGNDYTVGVAAKFRDFCGIKWVYDIIDVAPSTSVAEWVEGQTNILIESKEIDEFPIDKPNLKAAIQFSMDFYKEVPRQPLLTFTSLENENFWNYLVGRYQNGEISSICLSVFHGFCYQKNCVQPIFQGHDSDINSLLIFLRSKMYSLLVQDGISTVVEYEVPNTIDYTRTVTISKSSINLQIFLESNDINNVLLYFENNWSQDKYEGQSANDMNASSIMTMDYFQRFGTEIGFCCYCLRMLWCLTERERIDDMSLVLTEREFRAVFCMVFFRLLRRIRIFPLTLQSMYLDLVGKYPNDWFFKLKICPSSVCLTIQEWLQVIYFVAHTLYGRSLNIAQYFPEAFEFISGTVLSAFYEYVHNDGQRISHLDSLNINSIYELMAFIFDEFNDIYQAIVDSF